MKYKIVNKHNGAEFPQEYIGEIYAEQALTDTAKENKNWVEKHLIVVPSNYQWMYSQRNNGYRWMEPPFDNTK